MKMQLPTQAQFVADCLTKYQWEYIPADQQWEAAHFPLPSCSEEDDTVQLWSADHTVQGLLQSVELDHPCYYYKANSKDLLNLQTYYPEYLELFAQLKSYFNSRNGKKGGPKTVELKVGIHGRSAEQMTADNKKGGERVAELKVGVCGRSAEQMTADGKKGGEKGGATTGAQKWKCLKTGKISTPGPLSCWQKARGIDSKLRVKIE